MTTSEDVLGGMIVFLLLAAVVFFVVQVYNCGGQEALDAAKPCTADAGTMAVDSPFAHWVCHNGQWHKL